MSLAQTALIAFCLVLLIYIAFIITINYFAPNGNNALDQFLKLDSGLYNSISTGTNYIHQADTSRSTTTTVLNGLNFSNGQLILLADDTPYASKGHIAITLPCSKDNPAQPIFQVLVGRAPDLFAMPLGYLQSISSPPTMCIYHGQYGFGDPVSDLALKYIGDKNITLNGPYSVVLSSQEEYIPKAKSFEELQHAQMIK
ncbi:MAG: hypothetical protein ACTHLL_03870 [Candidatus Nitrosocosmicus sp.]|jgi:hypothetical protein